MSVAPSERVSLFGLNLPTSCPSRELLHTPCPGCGLTRSFVLLAHGRVADSLALHRLGLLMALFFLYQAGYRIYCLAKRGRNIPQTLLQFQTVVGLGMVAALILNWFIGLPFGGN
ncbi:MAG: DUF2752 domain-containing protein [Lentisphaeria bacterium]|nr:DUF2752 domain-containing protein [Lentisphaeria bacterium]